MKYLFTVCACLVFCATISAAYIAFPRTEVAAATAVAAPLRLPARPSLAQLKSALRNVKTIDTVVTVVDGRPFRCYRTDSTFSPTRPGATWGMQWCWRTSRADFAVGNESGQAVASP